MRFGVFDQNDANGLPIADQYRERLRLASLYDECGFHTFQMSEHHGTPLSTTPSPSVFLAALSQRTRTLRFGPLVYLLPGHNPLRLAEEIAMLDNLSEGRFEFGIGRGASPHEMGYLGVAPDEMKPMYAEALEIIRKGLTTGTLDHQGRYWQYDGVELSVRPVQAPHPPLWVALGSPDSAVWPAQNGANIVVGAPADRARLIFERYVAERALVPAAAGWEAPLLGLNRYVVVAESDGAAYELAERCWNVFYGNFIKLWRRHGGTPANRLPEDFAAAHASGSAIVGSAATVRAILADQLKASGANYLASVLVFGDMSFAEASRSIRLFAHDVMPALTPVGEQAHARLLEAA